MVCVLILAGGVMAAPGYDEVFDSGSQLYLGGDYGAAAARFQELADRGVVSAEIFYNLGNAYYRAGDVPRAILNYERVLQLRPDFDTARENLYRAVDRTERRLPRPAPPTWEQALFFWDDALSTRGALFWAGCAWGGFWLLLAAGRFRSVRYARIFASVLLAASGALTASWWVKAHPMALAVAGAERVPVHYGTDENETIRFELLSGDRVEVDGETAGWVRVVTHDGERGWARRDAMLLAGPPYRDWADPAVDSDGAKPAETS